MIATLLVLSWRGTRRKTRKGRAVDSVATFSLLNMYVMFAVCALKLPAPLIFWANFVLLKFCHFTPSANIAPNASIPRTKRHPATSVRFCVSQQTDGAGGDDDDIEVMDDDVVFVKDDNTPASTPAPAAEAAEPTGGESVTEAAVTGGGENRPPKKTSDKENDILGNSSGKEGVSKKRPASASLGESGDEGGPDGEAGVASSSTNGTAAKRATG